MASSDTSAVTKYFSTAAEGFTTTLSSTISASATSVGLNSTSGLTNGAVFVGIIEPGQTAQQTFTGTVDVGGSQITNVVWVRGVNVGHAGGVTIVDYVSGASHSMMTTGILKQHTQAGVHTGITTDTISTTGNGTIGGTLGVTGAATLTGGTVLPAGDIGTADVAAAAITAAKMVNGQVYRHQGDGSTTLGNPGTTTKDLSATDVKIQTGRATGNGNNSDTNITFPVAFTNTPAIIATPYNAAGVYPTWYIVSETNTGFTFRTGANVATFTWIAIGI